MTPEHWDKIEGLFQAALSHTPHERLAFLTGACGGDESLRDEVMSLLASHEKEGSFINSPAYQAAAEVFMNREEFKAGQTVGHYKIISTPGKGGIGEVYLAEDSKLHRKVAIKFLPADSVANGEANQLTQLTSAADYQSCRVT